MWKQYIDEYEYLEQMLSIYKHKKKKLEKQFIMLDCDCNNLSEKRVKEGILAGNLVYVLANLERLIENGLLDFVLFELEALGLSYLLIMILEKVVKTRKLENIDLDQLAMDYYNNSEKEKGVYAQMAMINEKSTFEPKVYIKREDANFYFD